MVQGLGVISDMLIAEIFPNKIRGAATAIAVLSLWAAYFVLVFTFPILFERMQDRVFYIYAVICLLGLVFIWTQVKETRGKTLEELEGVMKGH